MTWLNKTSFIIQSFNWNCKQVVLMEDGRQQPCFFSVFFFKSVKDLSLIFLYYINICFRCSQLIQNSHLFTEKIKKVLTVLFFVKKTFAMFLFRSHKLDCQLTCKNSYTFFFEYEFIKLSTNYLKTLWIN